MSLEFYSFFCLLFPETYNEGKWWIKNDKAENTENIKQQIDEALKEIEKLKNETTQIRNAAELLRLMNLRRVSRIKRIILM